MYVVSLWFYHWNCHLTYQWVEVTLTSPNCNILWAALCVSQASSMWAVTLTVVSNSGLHKMKTKIPWILPFACCWEVVNSNSKRNGFKGILFQVVLTAKGIINTKILPMKLWWWGVLFLKVQIRQKQKTKKKTNKRKRKTALPRKWTLWSSLLHQTSKI